MTKQLHTSHTNTAAHVTHQYSCTRHTPIQLQTSHYFLSPLQLHCLSPSQKKMCTSFKKKTCEEFSEWMREEGFGEETVDIFKDNGVDGESFLLLTDADLAEMVKAVGTRRKLIVKLLSLKEKEENSEVIAIEESDGGNCSHNEHSSIPVLSSSESDVEIDANHSKKDSVTSKVEVASKVKAEVSSTAFGHLKKMQSTVSKKKLEAPLPIPFELPLNYPTVVMTGLAQNKLSGQARPKFISSIASAIFKYKNYPTPEEYFHVGSQIIEKFPFLKSSSGSGHGYLDEALKDKMKYLRNAKPRCPPVTKDSLDEAEEPPVKKRKEFKQFPKSPAPPLIPSGEDMPSHQRHVKVLQQEEKKSTPNKRIIDDLMARTYPFRRKEILEEPQPIQQLFITYPSLKRSEQILAELDRIFNKDATIEFRGVWMESIPKVFKVAADEISNSVVQSLVEEYEKDFSEVTKSILATLMLVYLLPDTRMKADPSQVIIFLPEFADVAKEAMGVSPQPVVMIRGTQIKVKDAFLVCEKMVLSKIDAADIPVILFASYYAFNIRYPSGCTNYFSFLEVIFTRSPPPKRAKLNHFINMLEHAT